LKADAYSNILFYKCGIALFKNTRFSRVEEKVSVRPLTAKENEEQQREGSNFQY
jgi:hypothetical protein